MIINIKVVASAKKNLIKKENDYLKVYVSSPAVEGKANKAVLELLCEHFGVKKDKISIIKGLHSSRKSVEIKE
ncbi:MAG TPA: DUF167 domain-containing protein [Candidatus Omnitrophota bacterium]|nr:DUF167 domain-containing protein [Candidatus Omnitrophota bacterium]